MIRIKNTIQILFLVGITISFIASCKEAANKDYQKISKQNKTIFQTSRAWKPTLDNRGDAAVIYGIGGNPSDKSKTSSFEDRVKSWREKGYETEFMTGIAWGDYRDYFTGKWDGEWHLDEGQVTMQGDTLWHGHLVPYLVPSENFLQYMKEKHIKQVIDAGITNIYLEEPEFWARAGYSEAFKREWQAYYGFPWRPQDASPENTWLSSKLKYHLYYRALEEVFTYAKQYGKSKGLDIKCYVPTHSLINYSQWQIVSPEASLASMSCVDGYVAQVWTGTSREPNYFNGEAKERVFETAFLEYGCMESMTAPTGRTVYFLTDPIEDWPRDWEDYRRNYQATFTAQLLYPNNNKYEIMPWPSRVYEGLYSVSAGSEEKANIPRSYSTQMHVMINALNHMPLSANKISGSAGISVLMSNTLMFQRYPTHEGYDDPQLSNFYGQALPFLKRGIPVSTVHMENLAYPESLKNTKVLLMTYSNMKPMSSDSHKHLRDWVSKGGMLIYSGTDKDPFQSISEWWNQGSQPYPTASAQLFELMGLNLAPREGEYKVGKGKVYIIRKDPKEYVLNQGGDAQFLQIVTNFYNETTSGEDLQYKNNFRLTRGNYELTAVLDEQEDKTPVELQGNYIDMFDPEIPVIHRKEVFPGNQSMLFNLDLVKNKHKAQVLVSGARVYEERGTDRMFSFQTKGPLNTTNVMRILLPKKPTNFSALDENKTSAAGSEWEWDEASRTLWASFENNPKGVWVEVKY
ncbi:MAG: hypothetical protein ACK5L5_11550 [Bacteroidales bacterium]